MNTNPAQNGLEITQSQLPERLLTLHLFLAFGKRPRSRDIFPEPLEASRTHSEKSESGNSTTNPGGNSSGENKASSEASTSNGGSDGGSKKSSSTEQQRANPNKKPRAPRTKKTQIEFKYLGPPDQEFCLKAGLDLETFMRSNRKNQRKGNRKEIFRQYRLRHKIMSRFRFQRLVCGTICSFDPDFYKILRKFSYAMALYDEATHDEATGLLHPVLWRFAPLYPPCVKRRLGIPTRTVPPPTEVAGPQEVVA